ncbi:MAG: hypothetical protein DYH08_10620 [Actinobacteria bacterium ATB1]|nr:hypothetical protein [Actinobacteria bacterium ATB1]
MPGLGPTAGPPYRSGNPRECFGDRPPGSRESRGRRPHRCRSPCLGTGLFVRRPGRHRSRHGSRGRQLPHTRERRPAAARGCPRWVLGPILGDESNLRVPAQHCEGAGPFPPQVRVVGEEPSRHRSNGTIRRVLGATLRTPDDSRAEVWLEATSFCHQMVRSIVGLLEAVGHDRRGPGGMDEVLRSRDRSANSNVAPPHGLTLWRVSYGTETTP